MEIDPGGGPSEDCGLDGAFLDLALAADGAVRWRFDFADDEIMWMPGLDALLGMSGAAAKDVRARLRELIEPWIVAAKTMSIWQDLDLEQSFVTADGRTRLLHLHARPHGEQEAESLIGLAREVTGLHRDRQALTDLASRYRQLVELSPDAICVHQDEVIRYANQAMSSIVGAESSAQLLGRPLVDFVAPSSVPRMRERLRTLAPSEDTTARSEAELLRLDGATVPVELVAVHTTWEGRAAVQVIGRDVTAEKAARATLRYQAALVEHVNNAIIATDRDGTVTSWNPAAESVYGIPTEEALGRHVAELVGAPVRPESLLAGDGDTEAMHRRRDGASLVIRISAAEMESGYVLVCADETARRQAEQDFATVVAALDEGVIVVGPEGTIETANPAAERILGDPEREMVGSSPMSWRIFDESGNALRPEDYLSLSAPRLPDQEHSRILRYERPDGRSVWIAANSRSLSPKDRSRPMVVTSFTDITESRAARERLEYEATHDPLTALANRTLVLRHLGYLRDPELPLTVLFIDLDNFKRINDSLGHGAGDNVLRIIGQRLVRTVPDESLIGRLGGDEFVVVVENEGDRGRLAELSERLLGALTEPIHVQGRELHVDGSVGVLVSQPGDERTGQDLLRDADVAMYKAKTQGGGRYAFFDVELRERVQRHMILEQDLHHAVRLDQLWVAYQPVVDLATDGMVAVEGLLRWAHPLHGTVSPGEFIPLAEESDLIVPIGAHMLRVATRQLAAEREHGQGELQLNANLSPRQLEDLDLQSMVQHALTDSGFPARDLCFEITENAIMHDPGTAARVLNSLRELGVCLAIDDFGTGYSSLAQLRRLPLDILKIDRSFVTDLEDSDELRVIVTSIIAMAHAVDLVVVAEGIETPQQLAILRELGCDQVQGYYLGKPAPIDDLSGFIPPGDPSPSPE